MGEKGKPFSILILTDITGSLCIQGWISASNPTVSVPILFGEGGGELADPGSESDGISLQGKLGFLASRIAQHL